MGFSPITLDALQAIDAIDRRGSFARAAEELDKATSALSYTIQKLEEQLGVTLFQRQGRRSVLTPSGKLLLSEGRKILGATAFLADQVKELASGWEPRLRLGLETTTEHEPFFVALGKLLEEQPNLEIDIQECVLNGGWEALEMDSIDLLVGAPAPVPAQKGFRTAPIPPTDMLLVAAATHPLSLVANNPRAIAEQLPRCRRIVTHDTARQNVMRAEGLTTGRQVLYVQTMEQKIAAQLAGLGVGHIPRKLIQAHLDASALIELATEHPTSNKLERYIAWKVSNKGNALKRLTQLLGDTFK
ncbi:MAG: LysR family transcriptional regulator [Halieaceae bacterium]|nr:LysR family transcriptional regulator [Halieaceae bacterium]MCP5163809.1 LysR family transcriptional regulator [Pseudomonadales bacterium]MCP5202859.1 LysR family transcriptional regulator [Pseudomonadales bacterium]